MAVFQSLSPLLFWVGYTCVCICVLSGKLPTYEGGNTGVLLTETEGSLHVRAETLHWGKL